MTSQAARVSVSEREAKCLVALAAARDDYEDFCYLNFQSLQTRTGFDRQRVRRSVRALARKGLAQFGKGLWTDDGEMAGSGYCATKAGADLAVTLTKPQPGDAASACPSESFLQSSLHPSPPKSNQSED